jgi:hypothetical protein
MAHATSTTKAAAAEAGSMVGMRVAELRQQAATAPIEARDAAWHWFGQLGEEVVRDRETGTRALCELFAVGSPPTRIDGRTEGILVAPLIAGPVDRAIRALEGMIGLPWLGKRFDAAANRGDNVLRQSARWPAKLLWPRYRTRPLGADRSAFDFETRIEPSEDDGPQVDVLVIDYVVVDSNPSLIIKRIRDELVEVVPGANLGKVLWRHGAGSYSLIGFFALRTDPS